MLHTRPSSSSLHARPGFTSRSQASLSLPPGLGCTYGVGSLHGALLRHAAKADIRMVCCMRQAICILTLLVLTGFTATCMKPTDYNVPYRVVTANRSAVVIELAGRMNPYDDWAWFPGDRRSYLLTKAQSECDRYGKDAVLVRQKQRRLTPPSPLLILHYRCETR